MKDKDLTWDIVNSEKKGERLFNRYCWLNSCCEECNKKVRFWCKVKDRLIKHQEKIITKSLNKRPNQPRKAVLTMAKTTAMEGLNRFRDIEYTPTCRHGCEDCIYDPAYIKATYPEWYTELYQEKTPQEAACEPNGCASCKNGERYDDEDK